MISLWLTVTWEEQITDTDWGVYSWPWQSFARRKPDPPTPLWPVTDVFQLKHTGLKCIRVLCARDKQLFSVVFYVVTAVHKFDFRLVMYETPNEWRPVERRSCNDRILCFWQDLYVFRRPSSRVLRDSTHAVQVNCVLFTLSGKFVTHFSGVVPPLCFQKLIKCINIFSLTKPLLYKM